MLTRIAIVMLIALLLPGSPALADATAIAPAHLEDRTFRVFIDDKRVGEHRFRFSGEPGAFRLESTADFKYRLAFVTVFSYEHECTERWRGGCLVAVASHTQTGGDEFAVEGAAVEGGFSLEGGKVSRQNDADKGQTLDLDCAWGFAYWTPELRGRSPLINPQDGKVFEVEWEELGETPLKMENESVSARAWTLRSPEDKLDITLYYDAEDRWIGLDSVVEGSRLLRYRPASSDPFYPG